MKYKSNWTAAKAKWLAYWRHENPGRPLMCVIARKSEIEDDYRQARANGVKLPYVRSQGWHTALPGELMYTDMARKYRNAEHMVNRYRHFCETHHFLGESFPNINVDFGPGSIAAYLGSNVVFSDDTVWFEECVGDWSGVPDFRFDAANPWLAEHLKLVEDIRRRAGDDFYVQMPDLMEGIDVIASMRGAQNTAFDLVDEPEEIHRRIQQVNALYFEYYNRFHQLVYSEIDGGNAYTVFQIWGPGKTAKLQCDFSCMISPDDFRAFIQEPLRRQAAGLDTALYHLDGPDCIRHMDALMEIDELAALQWTSGDHGPDGGLPEWDIIYDKARGAGKSLWIKLYTGDFEDWLKSADRLVRRYGSHSLFLHFPEMSEGQAERLLNYAEKNWRDVDGTFRP